MSVQPQLPDWESLMIDEAIAEAETRYREEETKAARRTVELNRQQAYYRLALAIDRPEKTAKREHPGQLSFFPKDPTLFDVSA